MDFGSVVSGYVMPVLNMVLMVLGGLVVGGVLAGVYVLSTRAKTYGEYVIRIFERDSQGHIVESEDDAGVFLDKKTNNNLLFFRKLKGGSMNPDKIPYHLNSKGKKVVYVLRTGKRNFHYLTPVIKDDGIVSYQIGEEDINTALNIVDKYMKVYNNDWLMKYGPLVGVVTVSVIIMIMVIVVVNKFEVLGDVADTLVKVSENLRGIGRI